MKYFWVFVGRKGILRVWAADGDSARAIAKSKGYKRVGIAWEIGTCQ